VAEGDGLKREVVGVFDADFGPAGTGRTRDAAEGESRREVVAWAEVAVCGAVVAVGAFRRDEVAVAGFDGESRAEDDCC
jgi:hypothetical protein